MYLIHKYWARKPHNVVSEYIQHYTKEGDIVLDPFCGSGPTPIEAIKLGRKGVGIDLDPVATFITRMTAIPADISKIKSAFEEIKKNCKDEIEELYKTKCRKCKNKGIVLATIWSREKTEPLELRYYCNNCGKRDANKPDDDDLRLLKKVEKMEIPYWYPTQRLAYNGEDFQEGTHTQDINSVDKLFTRRNLTSLSIIFNQIEKISDNKIQDILKFAFTSMSHLASRMCPVANPGGKGHWSKFSATSFWSQHRYYLPIISMESNVWVLFDSAVNGTQGIINGKSDSNSQIKYYKEAKKFSDLNDGANIFIKTHSALELTEIIPPNSVDYVFTDPPYGGAVQYFELSTLWASWLKMELNYKEEITVNKQQNKDFEYYHKLLRASFKEIYQVLKPGKYMTVTFHSTDIKVWNSIIKAVVMVGFELEKIIYQPPARPSAKGLLQPYGSAVGDYYIRFRKPEQDNHVTEKEIDLKTYELEVIDSAQGIIGERGEPTIYQHILNGIMADLKGGRNVPVGAKNVEEVLKEHIGKEFELIPIKDEKGKTIGKKWWIKGFDISHFSQPTLRDRVERTVVSILDKNPKVSFDEILQSISIEFPNALTPETEELKDILSEYADPTQDGKWQLKYQVRVRGSEHSKMIFFLALLGKKAKYDVWIGLNEQASSYNEQKLSNLVSIKKPVWRFVSSAYWDRVNQIDVIWHDRGRIEYTFEVENTTAITQAIVRNSNIQNTKLKRLIIIPKERENFLMRKIEEPMIKENILKNNWHFIFYNDLENFLNRIKGKEKISLEDFEKIFKMPKLNRIKQYILNDYTEKGSYFT